MSKGIAINTILYLLVGIIVVGIVVYMVYTYVLGAPISENECRAMIVTWCTGCVNSQWGDGNGATAALQKCATSYFSPPSTAWTGTCLLTTCDCNYPSNTAVQNFCKAFVPF